MRFHILVGKAKVVLVAVVAVLAVGAAAGYYWYSLTMQPSQPLTTQASSCVRPPGYFLIIADSNGFNNSVAHLQSRPNEPWPVVSVHRGDRVNILVCNLDDYSPHGFAIVHYFDKGVALAPHETFRISFVADVAGTFTIYCNIICPVHEYMQDGQLAVAG
jgi:FtsP/CotA-like multicopper oxidase with cupredoxin domain